MRKIIACAVIIAVAGGAVPKGKPETCRNHPDDQVFYVDDIQYAPHYGNYPRLMIGLDVDRPGSAHRYFTLDADDSKDVAIVSTYVTMLTARLHDRQLGVEPKLKVPAVTSPDGPPGSIANPYILGSLSFGGLPGLCPDEGVRR